MIYFRSVGFIFENFLRKKVIDKLILKSRVFKKFLGIVKYSILKKYWRKMWRGYFSKVMEVVLSKMFLFKILWLLL